MPQMMLRMPATMSRMPAKTHQPLSVDSAFMSNPFVGETGPVACNTCNVRLPRGNSCAVRAGGSGDELDDLEAFCAARGLDLDAGADLGVHQRFADRRLGREAALGEVGLGRADQGPDVGLATGLVADFGGQPEGEGVG